MVENRQFTIKQSAEIARNLGLRVITATKERGPAVAAAAIAATTLASSNPNHQPQPDSTLTAGSTVFEVTSKTNPAQAHLEAITSAARATVAQKSMTPSAAKNEKKESGLTPAEHQKVQKGQLRVIAWERQRASDGLYHGYEGTGFVLWDPSTGDYRVMTAAHTFFELTGNKAGLGITSGQPIDLAKSPNFKNYRIVVANPLNQNDEWGTANGLAVANQDTALLKLDPNSISTTMKSSIIPLDPNQQIPSGPEAGIPVAMYAENQKTGMPVDGEGVTLGTAQVPWENNRTVYVIGINPPTVNQDTCYFWASGETAVLAGGQFMTDETRRITINPQAGDAPASTGQYQYNTIATQLPQGTMGNSTLCLFEPGGNIYNNLNSVFNSSTSTSTPVAPAPTPTPAPPPTLPGHGQSL